MLFSLLTVALAHAAQEAPDASPLQQTAEAGDEARATEKRPNIVLIVLDDIGVEKIGAYHEGPPEADTPCTPNLDALAREGMLFREVWANPVCSPTRAQILTGRHAFRTGIGGVLDFNRPDPGLSTSERTLPRILTGYDTSLVGKWHLTEVRDGALRHPLDCGFGFYSGSLFNIATPPVACGADCTPPDCSAGGRMGYTNWVKVSTDPVTGRARQECVTTYATTDTANDAIARAATMQAPWFLEVSFNAAHQPAQEPPPELLPSEEACVRPAPDAPQRFRLIHAVISALDTELGRMVAAIRAVDPEAIFLVIADNGTSIPGAQGALGSCFSPDRAKGTLYQSGIRVPLIVAGPGIARGECGALVSATDLFATIADLARVESSAQDSVSLGPYLAGDTTPRRRTVYAESFRPTFTRLDAPEAPPFRPDHHVRAVRDERYKLIRSSRKGVATEEFYDLQRDPCEEENLCPEGSSEGLEADARASLASLRAELVAYGVFD